MPPKSKPLIFMDSNVLFSGLYSSRGPAGIILEHFVNGKLKVVISQQVLEEVVRTIKEKLPEALPSFMKLLLNAPPVIVKDASPKEIASWSKIINEEDAGILASATAVKPDYLVTGDKHYFARKAIAEKSGLRIITPSQLLKELEIK